MLPDMTFDLNEQINVTTSGNINYKMHFEKEFINGFRDGLSTIKQVCYKILNTERYKYPIYSWNYGIELEDLFGKSVNFVCPVLEKRISEALTHDDRILFVDNFTFDTSVRNVVFTTFTVNSIFGEFEINKEVKLFV